jgi:hypothetical protein
MKHAAGSEFTHEGSLIKSARGWPYAPPESAPPKDPTPFVGRTVFARAPNGRWYPGLYRRGPHEMRPVPGVDYNDDGVGLVNTPQTFVSLLNTRAYKAISPDPQGGIVNYRYALHYMPTWSYDPATNKYLKCTYYGYKNADIYPWQPNGLVFRYANDIYKIAVINDLAVIY